VIFDSSVFYAVPDIAMPVVGVCYGDCHSTISIAPRLECLSTKLYYLQSCIIYKVVLSTKLYKYTTFFLHRTFFYTTFFFQPTRLLQCHSCSSAAATCFPCHCSMIQNIIARDVTVTLTVWNFFYLSLEIVAIGKLEIVAIGYNRNRFRKSSARPGPTGPRQGQAKPLPVQS
jgi:hypothetical protein